MCGILKCAPFNRCLFFSSPCLKPDRCFYCLRLTTWRICLMNARHARRGRSSAPRFLQRVSFNPHQLMRKSLRQNECAQQSFLVAHDVVTRGHLRFAFKWRRSAYQPCTRSEINESAKKCSGERAAGIRFSNPLVRLRPMDLHKQA